MQIYLMCGQGLSTPSREVKKAYIINNLLQKAAHLMSFSLESKVKNCKDEFHSKLCEMELDWKNIHIYFSHI